MSDLWLFARALFKCALYTGFLPAVILAIVAEYWWLADRGGKVIPIRKPGYPIPRRRKDRKAA